MRIITLSLLSLVLFAFTSEETYSLKLNLEKGDKYKMTVTSDQDIEISMNGQEMNMKQSFKMVMPSLVKEVSPS